MSSAWLLSRVLKIVYHLSPKSQMLFDVLPWWGAAVLPWWLLAVLPYPCLSASLFH
jgi:hypothetical protein